MKNKINIIRMILGSFISGMVLFLITGIVNGGILRSELENWMHGMGNLVHPLTQSISMCIWAFMCFLYGLAGMWIYASIRPHYGAGVKTALFAGFMVWLVGKFATALDLIALGLIPCHIIIAQLTTGLVGILLGTCLGAWLYKE